MASRKPRKEEARSPRISRYLSPTHLHTLFTVAGPTTSLSWTPIAPPQPTPRCARSACSSASGTAGAHSAGKGAVRRR